jgi:tetratricopeptide (TPR) repeat protein
MRNRKGSDGALPVSLRLGISVVILVAGAFLYAVLYLDVPFWDERDGAARFQKTLREYDALFEASKEETHLRNYDMLAKKLATLEAINNDQRFSTLQTTLSLLKRERAFAGYDPNFRARYAKNLLSAEKKYPRTVQLQALSIENAVKTGIPTIADALNIGGEGEHGSGTPVGTLLAAISESSGNREQEHLIVNAALLSIVTGNEYRETNAVLYPLDLRKAASVNTFRFTAEYAYDAGDFPLASRLFAALPDENALERAGDALFLGGDVDGARELWLLSSNANSLYNYASLADKTGETGETDETAGRTAALKKLLAQYAEPSAPSFTAGMILYTRLMSDDRAAATLGAARYTAQIPLLDLELWRRTEKNYPPGRALAGMWLLIGRHPQQTPIYEYASWYFGRERRYEELSLLLNNASLQGIDSGMLQYWRIMLDAPNGDNKRVREALAALPHAPDGQPWFVSANIGRLYEAERSWKNAVDHYSAALANAPGAPDKSRILQRTAVCLAVQGRNSEARAVLEEAVSLDPTNLTARSALNTGW